MSEAKNIRLSKAAREFNVGIATIVEFLSKKGFEVDAKPNTKLDADMYELLVQEYQSEKSEKEESRKIGLESNKHETVSIEDSSEPLAKEEVTETEGQELFIKSNAEFSEEEKQQAEAAKQEEEVVEEKPEEKVEEVVAEEPTKEESVTEEPTVEEQPVEEKAEVVEEEVVAEEEAPAKEEKVKEEPVEEPVAEEATAKEEDSTDESIKVFGKIDLDSINSKTKPKRKTKEEKEEERKQKEEDRKKQKEEAAATKKKVDEQKAKTEADEKEKAKAKAKATKEKKEAEVKAKKEAEEKAKKEAEEKEKATKAEQEQKAKAEKEDKGFIKTEVEKLSGPTILGKMDLPTVTKKDKSKKDKPQDKKDQRGKKKPVASSTDEAGAAAKKKRKRITTGGGGQQDQQKQGGRPGRPGGGPGGPGGAPRGKAQKGKKREKKPELSEEDIQKQIKETLARLSSSGKSKSSKLRRAKRDQVQQNIEKQRQKEEAELKVIKVTEFVTVAELASMMNTDANQVISTCMSLGLFVSINQRLDAETLTIVAEEFGFEVEFVSIDVQESISVQQEEDVEDENAGPRHPIVTVMGHVDHGKTSLLDYIRKSNVIAGEAGGITQHIGAYEVTVGDDRKITFLDTPGHEAFTAMRARGAQVTDIAIIIVAADDAIMPQTKEAINHAQAAGVPIIFAINKIDKPNANPEKVKEELATMNFLVEDWGGKYQSQDISAKVGTNIEPLLEKVLLEAELLELKANPDRSAEGTIIESSLDKGKGYVAKILVQNGTLKIGDVVLAGCYSGRVKAMYNQHNQKIDEAGPGTPVLLLGLQGAPQAGDTFNVMSDEREARNIATKRLQLQREQGIRTQKHITLDEIGRRIAIGDFQELNVIVKGDVDGSVEALSDSLLKLSTEEVQVNVIHKSVGQVTESDVLLASASDAIIVGFQVRPSVGARKLAEAEEIDIRLYSIIYQAIEEIKAAIEGMLSPDIEEKIVCNVEIRETFKISKVGTIAGCMVLDGKITKNTKIRLIRDGIVIYTGMLGSLKRFKDDVKEVATGYECGLNIENFNDIKVGDIIEGYEEVEVARKL